MATTIYSDYWTGLSSSNTTRKFRCKTSYSTSQTASTYTVTIGTTYLQCATGNCNADGWNAGARIKSVIANYSKDKGNPSIPTDNVLKTVDNSNSGKLTWGSTDGELKTVGSGGTMVIDKTTNTQTVYLHALGYNPSGVYAGARETHVATLTIPAYSVTLTYNANGGTGSISSVTQACTNEFTVSGQGGLTKAGYDFLGWSTSSTATTPDSAYAIGNTFTTTENVTLYAVWHLSYVAPSITDLRAYRVSSSASGVSPTLETSGTRCYCDFSTVAPVSGTINSLSVTFTTDDTTTSSTVTPTNSSGVYYCYSASEYSLSGSNSATVEVTISCTDYNNNSYTYKASTDIGTETYVWDAYSKNGVTSFSIGGIASETESRFDVELPTYLNDNVTASQNLTVAQNLIANQFTESGYATGDIFKLINFLKSSKTTYSNVNESNPTYEHIIMGCFKIVMGYTTITPSKASTVTTKTVNFGCTFKYAPYVLLQLAGQPEITTLHLTVSNTTTSNFTATIYASNTTTRSFRFFAFGDALDSECITALT